MPDRSVIYASYFKSADFVDGAKTFVIAKEKLEEVGQDKDVKSVLYFVWLARYR
jgi:hypothetical protein